MLRFAMPTKPKIRQKPVSESMNGRPRSRATELVIITGMSGSGKASVMKAFEDLGFYCVDNLPAELMPPFVELVKQSPEIERAALVVDIREGNALDRLPRTLSEIKKELNTKILFLEASDEALVRRFSETRRPHPLDKNAPVSSAISAERKRLDPIRNLADEIIDTSKFNVHELRQHIIDKFQRGKAEKTILISCVSFGFKNGVPPDVDLVFDVRFLPNPHFVPEFRPYTGLHPKVAAYIRKFPQTREFIKRISQLLIFLLPHYIREGKSYLTIGFGCTGGQHRSVMIAEDVRKHLEAAGYNVKTTHRDVPKA